MKINKACGKIENHYKNINNTNRDTFFTAIEAIRDEIYILDSASKIKYINKAGRKFLKISTEDIFQTTLEEIASLGLPLKSIYNIVIKTEKKGQLIQETVNRRRLLMEGYPVSSDCGELEDIVIIVQDITENDRLQKELEQKEQFEQRYIDESRQKLLLNKRLVVASKSMVQIMELVLRMSQVDSNVLILGETGVGKEVLAKIIHEMSHRYMGPFIKIDCGSIPETLIESELFGYESGAFSGAKSGGKTGMMELANGGTVFLDEVGELPLPIQVKLLQVLQESRFRKVGGTKIICVDIRVISATNRNLEKMVAQGSYRQDLFYRLNVVPIKLPPLRDRTEEIPDLVNHFLSKLRDKYKTYKTFSPKIMKFFMNYQWPGNIRELENMVERLVVTTKEDVIDIENLPEQLKVKHGNACSGIVINQIVPLKEALEKVESDLVKMAYEQYKSSTKVGKALCIDQSTAIRKIHKYIGTS